MCDLCDDPDLTGTDVLDLLRDQIDAHRFTTLSVGGSRSQAEFSYTVGLTEHGVPELVVVGLRAADAARLLDLWGDHLLDTSLVLPGETLESGPWCMEAVAVDRPEQTLVAADALYGPDLRALQLVWADAAGRFPWDPGRRRSRPAGQRLLGRRAPHYCHEHAQDRLDVPPHL